MGTPIQKNHVRLFPFSATETQLSLFAEVSRQGSFISIEYRLEGDLFQVRIPSTPATSQKAQRKNQLWEHTCYEAFLGIPGDPSYWELNLSPSGDWNCYHFDSYRAGQREEARVQSIQSRMITNTSELQRILIQLDFSNCLPQEKLGKNMEMALTAVVERNSGEIGYWALKHCGNQPDFHLRESFQLLI